MMLVYNATNGMLSVENNSGAQVLFVYEIIGPKQGYLYGDSKHYNIFEAIRFSNGDKGQINLLDYIKSQKKLNELSKESDLKVRVAVLGLTTKTSNNLKNEDYKTVLNSLKEGKNWDKIWPFTHLGSKSSVTRSRASLSFEMPIKIVNNEVKLQSFTFDNQRLSFDEGENELKLIIEYDKTGESYGFGFEVKKIEEKKKDSKKEESDRIERENQLKKEEAEKIEREKKLKEEEIKNLAEKIEKEKREKEKQLWDKYKDISRKDLRSKLSELKSKLEDRNLINRPDIELEIKVLTDIQQTIKK